MTTMKQLVTKWITGTSWRWSTKSMNLPPPVAAIARAHGMHTFNVGDPAVLLYRYKNKIYKAQVKVVEAVWTGPLDVDERLRTFVPQYIRYTVRSEHGGTMIVGAPSLRPGSAIDRIALALELDEISEASE